MKFGYLMPYLHVSVLTLCTHCRFLIYQFYGVGKFSMQKKKKFSELLISLVLLHLLPRSAIFCWEKAWQGFCGAQTSSWFMKTSMAFVSVQWSVGFLFNPSFKKFYVFFSSADRVSCSLFSKHPSLMCVVHDGRCFHLSSKSSPC